MPGTVLGAGNTEMNSMPHPSHGDTHSPRMKSPQAQGRARRTSRRGRAVRSPPAGWCCHLLGIFFFTAFNRRPEPRNRSRTSWGRTFRRPLRSHGGPSPGRRGAGGSSPAGARSPPPRALGPIASLLPLLVPLGSSCRKIWPSWAFFLLPWEFVSGQGA